MRCNSRKNNVRVQLPSFIGENVLLENNTFIGRFCNLEKTKVGEFTYMGNGCEFSNSRVGSFCSISSNVRIVVGTHPSSGWISTHPLFFSKQCYVGKGFCEEARFDEYKTTENGFFCEIGNDVWIGTDVNILQGITIGDGAIVGANSLVTKDVPPYSIVAGVPAKIVRKRFSDEDIEFLEKVKWWNWDYDKIRRMSSFFNDMSEFRKHI